VSRVVITGRAERDLEVIWLTIAPKNPSAATRLLRSIARKIELLADFPRLATHRPDIAVGLRMMVARPYLVLYDIHPG